MGKKQIIKLIILFITIFFVSNCSNSSNSDNKKNSVSVEGITLNKSSTSILIGDSEQLFATISPLNATNTNITWTSNKPSIADVSSSGLVTTYAVGTTTISVTTEDGSYTDSCDVTVLPLPIYVNDIVLNKSSMSLIVGNTEQLFATISPSNATNQNLTWSSDNPSIADVSPGGMVSAYSEGTVMITVTTDDGGYSDSCEVTVSFISIIDVTLNKKSTSILIGNIEQLFATISPSNATNQNITWSSSNPSIADVSPGGMVSTYAVGTTTISVTTEDGSYTDSCEVTVLPVLITGIYLNKNSTSLIVGNTEQLFATITPSNATNQNITWSSDNPAIADVSTSGVVTAYSGGSALITVTTEDGQYIDTCTIEVVVPVTDVLFNTTSTAICLGETKQLAVTITPSNATNQNIIWSTTDADIATVSSSGLISTHGVGQATINAITEDGGYSVDCHVTVYSKYKYIAAGSAGLKIFDMSDPTSHRYIGAYKSVSVNSLAIKGDFAYIVNNSGLIILNISNPVTPVLVSFYFPYNTMGTTRNVYVQGNYAYLAADKGMVIININNPMNPEYVSKYLYEDINNIHIKGNYAYLSSQGSLGFGNSLVILNISDITNPVFVNEISSDNVYDVWISGNYAYIVDYLNGLRIYDISNPLNPNKLTSFYISGTPKNIRVIDNYAYVGLKDYGFCIVDISNKKTPRLVTREYTGGTCSISVNGEYAFVADSRKGLITYNISDPSKPVIAGRSYISTLVKGVGSDGNFVYTIDEYNDLVIYDITDPSLPISTTAMSVDDFDLYWLNIEVNNGYAYVGIEQGILSFDISDPSSPTVAGPYKTSGRPNYIRIDGNYAYVTKTNLFIILDISDPTNISYIGGVDTPHLFYEALSIDINGDYAYIADSFEGVKVFNIKNKSKPIYAGVIEDGLAHDVAINGDYAFVTSPERLEVLKLSNPVSAYMINSIDYDGVDEGTIRILLKENYAFIRSRYSIDIMDITDPYNLVLIKSIGVHSGFSGGERDFCINGNYLCVGTDYGLRIIDISTPSEPIFMLRDGNYKDIY